MVTVLDLGLIQAFDVIFPVLLVFALVFAIFQKTKVVGDSVGINSIIAVSVAFMVLISDTLTQIINFMVPWFAVVIIFFILLILIFQMFGATDADLATAVKDKSVYWAILGIALVILLAALGNVLGQSFTEKAFEAGQNVTVTGSSGVASSSFEGSVTATLFHPKVLGMMIMFAIAVFAVALLSGG
ncbi:hypothetical protein HON71_05045 [Candidatus Woesearchaeota archaeon]|jgi:hypothetical protein|nr:hypothetical protein [Candidatus Woesearchaeota archaeon]